MTDRNALRRPIMRLITAVVDDRLSGDLTLGQIADDLLAEIEPLIRADERERIAVAIDAAPVPGYVNNHPSIYVEDAVQIAQSGGRDE